MAAECTDEQWKVSREWGKRHGYKGAIGGWIYDPEGTPVVQGWGALFWYIGEEKMMGWAAVSGILKGDASTPTSSTSL